MTDFPNMRSATLPVVIATAASGERGFRSAANHCRDAHLRSLLRFYAEDCATFVRELEACVESPGTVGRATAASNDAHAAWWMLDAAVRENDDFSILQACERSESQAQRLYREALRSMRGSSAHAILERLSLATDAHLDRLRQLTSLFAQAG